MTAIDISGQRFGKLVAVKPTKERSGTHIVWECICDCGNIHFVGAAYLKRGGTKSCGCLHDISGQRFGRLIAVEKTNKKSSSHTIWKCICDCGKESFVSANKLNFGSTQSCGCLKYDACKTHGLYGTPEHIAWRSMINRCKPNHCSRKHYYDRGISVCDEWKGGKGFENFFSHIGPKPTKEHSVDRINVNKGYEVGNVRWATRSEQANNKTTKKIENFSDEEMIQEMNRRGFRVTKTKKWKEKN
jgi:hypothetical protein